MYRNIILVVVLLLFTRAWAQISYIDSKQALDSGVALYDKGEYKKALQLYRLVDEGDTNYASAVYEQVLALQADSSFAIAKQLAIVGLNLPNADKRLLLLALAADYDYLQNPDTALIMYDSIMKLYPNDHQPWFEEGVLFFRQKLYDKAIAYFQRSLIMEPTHFKSHYLLGLVYLMQGRLSEGLIALQASLLMTNSADYAKKSVSLMSSVAQETDEVSKAYHNKAPQYSDPLFDEIDEIVNARLALNKDYQLKMSIADDIFRQIQVVMEKLQYNEDDTNFVMQYYVPLLKRIYAQDNFENYILYSFSGYGFEDIDRAAKAKSKEMGDMKTLLFSYLDSIQTTRVLNYEKRKSAVERYNYYPKGNEIAIGETVSSGDGKMLVGDATFLRYNHTLSSRGHFDSKGNKEGWWTYYFSSGRIDSRLFYQNDTVTDSGYSYFQNGNLQEITLKDKHGNATTEYEYDYAGWLSYVREKLSDSSYREISYYSNGKKEKDVVYQNGKLRDGKYEFYYINGMPKSRFSMDGGEYTGTLIYYYDDGDTSEVATYIKGVLNGPYEDHYESGALKKKHNNINGKAEGPYEEYYENGAIAEKGTFKKGNKEELTKYSNSGKAYGILKLHDNVPMYIKYINEDSAVVFEQENKRGIYDYPLFNPNGNKSVDMKINDTGYRNGVLTFYYTTGAKSEESNYKGGDLEGTTVTFYNDGTKKSEGSYANDEKDGYFKYYYHNGIVSEEGWYKKGKKQGLWRSYYVNGKLDAEKYYLNDKIDGYEKKYNINGELVDKYLYDKGLVIANICYDTTGEKADSIFYNPREGSYELHHSLHAKSNDMAYDVRYGDFDGTCTIRYGNGRVRERYYYLQNNRDSLDISYFPNGIVSAKGRYRRGNKIGKWQYFNEVGELTSEESYNNQGELHGSKKIYSCGSLRKAFNFRNGNQVDTQTYYGENGSIAFALIYDDNVLTGYTYQGNDGKLLPVTRVKNGTVKMTTYYPNGQKSGEANFSQNIITDHMKIYYSNGQLSEERNFKNYYLDGPYRRYTPDGKLVFDATYKDDQEHGIEKIYDKNGNLAASSSYYYGWRHGATTIADPATGKSQTYYYHYGKMVSAEN